MPLTLVMPIGSSIVSHSVSALSGSCTGSRISAGRSPSTLPAVEQGSSSGHWFIGKDKISPVLRKRLIEELNINANYTNPSATGLRFAWGRFLECTAALAQAKEMVEAGSWPADIPLFTEWMVIEVFIGTSTWYANYILARKARKLSSLQQNLLLNLQRVERRRKRSKDQDQGQVLESRKKWLQKRFIIRRGVTRRKRLLLVGR
jgi:hypothetical protein